MILPVVLLTALLAPLADTVPPGPSTHVTATSRSQTATLEWVNPADGDFGGTLVLRVAGATVTDVPVDGQAYNAGDTIGSSTVACVTAAPGNSCVDPDVLTNDVAYAYAVFAFDNSLNYAGGVATKGLPRSTATYKWAFSTAAATLAPAGAAGTATTGQYVVGIGNDRLLHRMDETNGTRGAWRGPVVGGAVQSRPTVGDINPLGAANYTAFLGAQNGFLYRFSLDADGTAYASRNAVADAGCPAGMLQAAPVVMLDAFDSNTNNTDDVVIVATRCNDVNGDGTLNENKILMYSHDLSTLYASYDGGGDGLGISNAAPKIRYRDLANNLVYVPLREDGVDNESLVVLGVLGGPTFPNPAYSELTNLGDVDCVPELFNFAGSNNWFLTFGNTAGKVYLYDAENRVGGLGSALVQKDTIDKGDGAVKGIAVSTPVPTGGLPEHWVVWSTNTKVHGAKVYAPDIKFDAASYWSADIASPSTPIVLRNVGVDGNTLAYVGSSDGRLYELNALTGAVVRSWLLESGKTIGDPTFDYNDGVTYGIVVGSTGGFIHWVNLN